MAAYTEHDLPSLREDLAAAYRICAAHGFNEGVCNHLTVSLSYHAASSGSASLVIAHGLDWSEVTADNLLLFDNHTGAVLQGEGKVEATAFQIHAAIHRTNPKAHVVFHTHMPYATAICSLKDGTLQMINQNCMRFFGRLTYDREYRGLVEDPKEGERISSVIGKHTAMLMANHGVMLVGNTIAEAWHELYYLERACTTYILARSTQAPLLLIPDEVARYGCNQELNELTEYANLHFAAQKRLHAKTTPILAECRATRGTLVTVFGAFVIGAALAVACLRRHSFV